MLKFNENTIESVRKEFNLDKQERIEEAVDLLVDWLDKQEHFLKKDFSRGYLERMLIAAKGSVERTKERIERGCTLKTLMPQFFEDFDVKNFSFHKKISIALLPKLTKAHERIFFAGNMKCAFTQSMNLDTYKYAIMLSEYLRAYDYPSAFRIVIDYRAPNFAETVANFSLFDLRKLALILIEGYGVRIKGIHLITDSKFMSILLAITKQTVPKKLSNRIFIHQHEDGLKEFIDDDLLPSDYGGKEKPLDELHEDWVETISSKEFKDYWRVMIEAKTNESLRRGDTFNEQYMGMPGSFRNLSVD